MKRTLAPSQHSTTNFYTDIFEALGINEEWEDADETTQQEQEDAKVLAEYGY
jgi:hypothetical protein